MKFYNPFKAHIVECNGVYYVRALRLGGWEYLCHTSDKM